MKFTSYIERDIESGMYVATVPSLPGAHTQAETLDELMRNLREVVELCLEELKPEIRQFSIELRQESLAQ